jgi:hypothetical protein
VKQPLIVVFHGSYICLSSYELGAGMVLGIIRATRRTSQSVPKRVSPICGFGTLPGNPVKTKKLAASQGKTAVDDGKVVSEIIDA